MDKVWDSVYKACRAYEEVLGKGKSTDGQLEAIVDAYANAIAQGYEQEVNRRTQKAEVNAVEMSKKAFDLQVEIVEQGAQVALMAEALAWLCRAVWYGTDDDRQAAYDKAQLVLSAAPKVVARIDGRWSEEMGYYTLTVEAIQNHEGGKLGLALRSPDPPDDKDGQRVDVLVLAQQGQESEQEE